MKKLFAMTLVVAAAAIVFSACKKSDDPATIDQAVGTFKGSIKVKVMGMADTIRFENVKWNVTKQDTVGVLTTDSLSYMILPKFVISLKLQNFESFSTAGFDQVTYDLPAQQVPTSMGVMSIATGEAFYFNAAKTMALAASGTMATQGGAAPFTVTLDGKKQ